MLKILQILRRKRFIDIHVPSTTAGRAEKLSLAGSEFIDINVDQEVTFLLHLFELKNVEFHH